VLASVSGIGRKFARVLHEDMGIDSLEELEAAAYDGRLAKLQGFGPKRIAGIRDSLAARLGRIPKNINDFRHERPPLSEILDVDREYREKVDAGALHKIAPRRFNPKHEAWLPILHTVRDGRHYTVLFSNTARAHELQKTVDWVVIYYDTDDRQRQYTVISSERGAFSGKRIVRGREPECREYYFGHHSAAPPANERDQVSASRGPL
jgi:DNA polymerase (family 10)